MIVPFLFDHGTIGDMLFAEPALRALSRVCDEPVPLCLMGPARELFTDHPHLTLLPGPPDPSWIRLDPMAAFQVAWTAKTHFARGFLPQVCLGPDEPAFDPKPRLYGPPFDETIERDGPVVLLPFSANCDSLRGGIRNKMAPEGFWEEFVALCPHPLVSLGGPHDPPLTGTESWRGRPLREVASLLAASRAVVTLDTGLALVAGVLNCDIVYLSAALPFFMTDPQTAGRLRVLHSRIPTAWQASDALSALAGLLEEPPC